MRLLICSYISLVYLWSLFTVDYIAILGFVYPQISVYTVHASTVPTITIGREHKQDCTGIKPSTLMLPNDFH